MKKKGEITVFLSLIMLSICALMAGLLESARTAGARCYLAMASNSALDSVMSGYHRQLWEDYHILMLEAANESQLVQEYNSYLSPYLEAENFYPMGMADSQLTNIIRATDKNGRPVEEEILAYMKYAILENALTKETVEQGIRNLKEAGNIKDVAALYSSRSKEAFQLEEVLQTISHSLTRQKELYEDGVLALKNLNGYQFREAVDKLDREMGKMPGLRVKYEKRAGRLEDSLEKTKQEYSQRTDFFQDNVISAIEAETSCYDAYIDADGMRRQEIAALEQQSAKNREVIEKALDRASQVEDIIDSWDDEEDGDLDERELWNSVLEVFEECRIDEMESAYGIKDTEKKKTLEKIQDLVKFDLLSLVLPKDRKISKGVLPTKDFPSVEMEVGLGWDMEQIWKEKITDIGNTGEELIKNAVMNEYASCHFTNFMTDTVIPDKNQAVQYEMEYLLGGEGTDEGNLESIIKKMLLIREGSNLIHILTDNQKREEANALAASIVGISGMAPLVAVTAFFIMGVWALAEAIIDVKMLLSGQNVPLVKTKNTWRLELGNLLDFMDGTIDVSKENNKEGFNYETYLKLFLLFQNSKVKCYRFMDVIQMNIKRTQENFLIKQCGYQLEFSCTTEGRFRLTAKSAKAY